MRVLLLRHGMTKGNLEKRYVGRTDETLTPSSAEELRRACESGRSLALCRPENLRALYMSPMKRCLLTAELLFPAELYPDAVRETAEELRECDFGLFEYKNYRELSGDAVYQHFIDTMGAEGFPGGERTEDFKRRCVLAFSRIIRKEMEVRGCRRKEDTLIFIVHGGTIMAVLEALGVPGQGYYSWQVKNGEGFFAEVRMDEKGDFYLTDVAKVRIL